MLSRVFPGFFYCIGLYRKDRDEKLLSEIKA
jgi:hypothetical protein